MILNFSHLRGKKIYFGFSISFLFTMPISFGKKLSVC